MKKTILLWKEILSNPFEGYKGINDSTKIFPPLLIIIVLFLISTTMIIPIMTSEAYGDALVRVQLANMAEQGQEMSAEQQAAMAEQIKSPMVRNITVVSAYIGGIITFIGINLLTALILKLVAGAVKKEAVKFSLLFKVLLFALIVSMVQSLVKMGITLSGDWQRALARATENADLQMALQAPVSLAALLDPKALGRQLYFLVDYVTDFFNWIYYVLLYAGLKSAVGLEKKQALIITIITAVLALGIALLFTLIG